MYDSIVCKQLRDGIIEVVEVEKGTDPGPVRYLPHHVVIQQDKETTKVRIM